MNAPRNRVLTRKQIREIYEKSWRCNAKLAGVEHPADAWAVFELTTLEDIQAAWVRAMRAAYAIGIYDTLMDLHLEDKPMDDQAKGRPHAGAQSETEEE